MYVDYDAYDFQSPIRRVSGCNGFRTLIAPTPSSSFSPLYVGSVVVTEKDISDRTAENSFSPLYVGSVVVTTSQKPAESPFFLLSVPYTSGQWL